MKCYVHPADPAVGACVSCGRFVCDVCRVTMTGRIYCKQCLERADQVSADAPQRGRAARRSGTSTLYRSRTDRLVGGVCAGVARQLDLDPTLVRVLWLVLTIFTAMALGILYIVLWIVLPEEP